jgi:hypothetical protein
MPARPVIEGITVRKVRFGPFVKPRERNACEARAGASCLSRGTYAWLVVRNDQLEPDLA